MEVTVGRVRTIPDEFGGVTLNLSVGGGGGGEAGWSADWIGMDSFFASVVVDSTVRVWTGVTV